MHPEHLYIHVPFCVRRCGYCDFAVTATTVAPVDRWLSSVAAEWRLRAAAERWPERLWLDTIYVGGGTPSLLGTGAMLRLAELLHEFADWDPARVEWTAEANPESFTPELAHDWRAAGVNRVSLGAQTFHEPVLRWMGRLHGPDGPARAMTAAREAGLADVSVDLIFGLPARFDRDWSADLDRTLELEPTHVSLYGLTAEPATPLGRWVGTGRERLADEEQYAAEFLLAAERLPAAGFAQYEVSNFGLPGRDSRHNRAYWRHRSYVGIGAGAHSFARGAADTMGAPADATATATDMTATEPARDVAGTRSWNVRDWADYSRRVLTGETAEAGREELSPDDVALERIWLGLRTDDGLPLDGLSAAQRERVDRWRASGQAIIADGRVRLTRYGWLLLDELAVELEVLRG